MTETIVSNPEKPRFCGKPGRSGPAKGNTNAMRHGLKAGNLPRSLKYIETRMNKLRREIEATVIDVKGEIGLCDAAYIQTCMRWERHAALAQRWLSQQLDELKPEQRLLFSREIARASAERDKALSNLKLDRDSSETLLETLYAQPARITEAAEG